MEFPVKTGAPAQSTNRVRDLAGVRRRRSCAARRRNSTRGARRHQAARAQRRRAEPSRRAPRWFTARKAPPPRAGCSSAAASSSRLHGETLCTTRSRRPCNALRGGGTKEATSYLGYDTAAHSRRRLRRVPQRRGGACDRLSVRRAQEPHGPAGRLTRLGIGLPSRHERGDARRGIKVGTAVANGSDLARDLGNRPPNVCTPSHLADCRAGLAKRYRAHGGQGARRSRHAAARHGRAVVRHAEARTSRRG